jgi:hypothetical protein
MIIALFLLMVELCRKLRTRPVAFEKSILFIKIKTIIYHLWSDLNRLKGRLISANKVFV